MPSGPGERYDFFLSRRGSVAAIAREVTDVLTEKGYRVLTQDYDPPSIRRVQCWTNASTEMASFGQARVQALYWELAGFDQSQGKAVR
jgi:hypothetical protein